MSYTTKYEMYSFPSINKASLEVRDNIMKVLKDNNYSFMTYYNDLYFLKSGQTVRRLKGGFNSNVSTSVLIILKALIKSCSTDMFECDINYIKKYPHYMGCESSADPSTFIIKITNK